MLGERTDFDPPNATERFGSPSPRDRVGLPCWGPWASLSGTIVGLLVFRSTHLLTLIGFVVIRQVVRPGGELAGPGWLGIVDQVGSVLAALTVVGLVALLIAVRGWPVAAYLAWRPPSGSVARRAIAATALVLAMALGLAIGLDRPIVTPTPPEAARGVPLGLVILTVAVALPVAEEVLFRGFLWRGLAESRVGPGGAIGLSALLWAGYQAAQVTPVNLYSAACLYLFGLFLGLVRYLSASLPLTVIVHGIASAVALAEAIYFTS